MKKRMISLLLCVCMVLTLFAGTATAVGDRVATIYDDNIGRKATFNPDYIGYGSFPISAAPENEISWPQATPYAGDADLVMVIIDAMVVRGEYWFKVEAAEGYELPADLAAEPWIFQNMEGAGVGADSLIVDMESAPEETVPEETVPEETVPEETVPEETEPSGTTPDDPSQDEPGADEPSQDEPGTDEPGTGEPGTDEPSQDEPGTDEPNPDDPTQDDPGSESTGLEWMSYSDYITAQMESVFADPSVYVGFEAAFDLIWGNFRYAADPSVTIPGEDENLLPSDQVTDAQGNGLRIKITGFTVDAEGQLWYQIEAAEGYTLPDVLVENPYILHAVNVNDLPSLMILPLQGMFVGETVDVLKNPEGATPFVTLPTAELPGFFDIQAMAMDSYGNEYYDLGDTTGWHATLLEKGYHYVPGGSVILIPPEVSAAYEKLKNADSAEEFNEIWENLPESVRNLFTDKHLDVLDQKQEALYNVEYETVVEYNGVSLNVSVVGPIPQSGVTLHVSPVSADTVLSEGFDINDVADIITALDIKLLRDDNSEWQPADGERIGISIDMASLGIPDETVVRVHHKHGDYIDVFEVFVVLDGCVTLYTGGLSTFAVTSTNSTDRAENVTYNNNGIIEMTVGQDKIFYNNVNTNVGTWSVLDTSGAVYYTVHSSGTPGSGTLDVPWIRIVALKEATDVTLTFRYGNNGNNVERYTLRIVTPKATNGRALYLKDDVNKTGRIVATLVDNNGKEIKDGLAGAAFTWKRSDNALIIPFAYGDDNASVNIARDHGGLVEARKEDGIFEPITYTVSAILSDGEKLTAEYTVYYQSEILNAGFEAPKATTSNYTFYPNGWPELYWKTTAPGAGNKLTNDIEYGSTNNRLSGTGFGVTRAADAATGGTQFAELNAEAFGALYQDIISAPGEEIEWDFSHAPRQEQSWLNGAVSSNSMFIVIGATESAQKLTTQQQLEELGAAAKQKAAEENITTAFNAGQRSVTITYNKASYVVWYHVAGRVTQNDNSPYTAANNYGWSDLSGSYIVPDGQYRTRLFFVTDPPRNNQGSVVENTKNFGNLIDKAKAGQYKTFMIEYYEQTYNGGKLTINRIDDKQETGEALIYSSYKLQNYDYFISTEHDYLYKILVNGKVYPYDISYAGYPTLYIEKYLGTPTDQLPDGNKDYAEYDIVLQVILRDTVVAVQKILEFPVDEEGNQLLTEVQKLTIMADLNKNGGYKATFTMDPTAADISDGYTYHQEDSAVITARDPAGNYKGFIALGDNPKLDHNYQIEETALTPIPGLELDSVTFGVVRYSMGSAVPGDDVTPIDYDETYIQSGKPLVCKPFRLEGTIKIADVTVTNTYREKMTKIYYKAVGNGKVALNGQTDYVDTPMEELAFYSGQSKGVQIHTGNGAFFVGWFKDEACTQEVTAKDGVVDPVTGEFRPNANIINADEITFYAKFSTASITINRTGAEEGQSFVYHVWGETEDHKPVDLYVTVICGKDGSGSTTITEMMKGTYHVEEVTDWSWRFDCTDTQKDVTITGDKDNLEQTVTFTGGIKKPKWLSGLAEKVRNIFKEVSS